MRRALELARKGWGRVHPNPLVGAVVVRDGLVVGEGYHAEYGGPHAEMVALAMAGDLARGASLFVTLEPCAHADKQPACSDLVARDGVARVVVAMLDPNPVARGGEARLSAAGIVVEVGLERDAAERLNAVYVRAGARSARPFVAVKLATSIDHRIADQAGVSRWISGEEARDWVHWFRAGFGAIGVGGRTAQVDDPMLTVRGGLEPRIRPTRVVFLGRRRPAPDSALVRTAKEVPTIFLGAAVSAAEEAQWGQGGVDLIPVRTLEEGMVALKRRGIDSIVIEGGGRLTGALLAEDLVDQFALIVSPVWLGELGIPASRGHEVPSLLQADRWVTAERRALGQDTMILFDRR